TAGKKPAVEHPTLIEDAKQSVAYGRSLPWPVTLSTLEVPQDRRAAVNPATIAAQPPPFITLESVPRLGEKSRHPSTAEIANSPLGIVDRRSDRRPSTFEFVAEQS
ncbi:hypothetical protein B296_00054175, partial [Ensete ventricosum]